MFQSNGGRLSGMSLPEIFKRVGTFIQRDSAAEDMDTAEVRARYRRSRRWRGRSSFVQFILFSANKFSSIFLSELFTCTQPSFTDPSSPPLDKCPV